MSVNYLEKSIDCILLEIAFTSISYGMNDNSVKIIDLLKNRNSDKDYPVIAEVMLLLNKNKTNTAYELIVNSLESKKIKDDEMLRVFKCLVLKLMGDEKKFFDEINKLLLKEMKDQKALIFAKELLHN